MLNKDHRYLKLVKYKNIENWSVSHILGMNMGFNKKYPLIPIGHIIEKSINSINIEDHVTYKQITLKINGGGTVLRDVKPGKLIGTKKQFVVSAGQFIMSKIDARNGAFGVIGTDLDGAVVTADFPVFNVVKERVTPEYLTLVSSTAQFVRFAQTCSRGTTNRQRIDVNLFLSQKIPLPSLSEQQALIKSYNNKIQQAETLEKHASEIEQNIEDYLLTELGIKQNINTANHKDEIKKEYKYLKFIKFKDSERWDADFLFGTASIDYIYSSKFSIVHARDFILNCQYGSSNKADKNSSNIPVLRMNNIQNGEFNTADLKYLALSKKELSSYKLNKGDLVFNRTNSKELVGKTAVFDMDGDYVFASYLIRVVLDSAKANVYYINYLFGSKIVRDQIDLISRQILGQANINVDEMKAFLIPLPPLSVQEEIVININKIKTQIKELRQQAANLRKEALEKFEKEIFE